MVRGLPGRLLLLSFASLPGAGERLPQSQGALVVTDVGCGDRIGLEQFGAEG